MLVAVVLCGGRDWNVVKQKEIRKETPEMNFFRSVTGYTLTIH